jgi:uncharacterized protein (DUF1330 family)
MDFPPVDASKAWFLWPVYRPACADREGAATWKMFVVARVNPDR